MKICKDVEEWIEENIEQEVEKQERRCKKWPWPLNWLCSLVTFIVKVVVTVMKKVVRLVCEVIAIATNVLAAAFNLVLAIPIVGPIVKAIIRTVTAVLSYIGGQLDGIGRLLGLRITKHLRVHVILLCDGVVPLAYEAHIDPIMRETERIFYERAQIRVHTTFHEPIRNPPENALRVGAEADLIVDELWLKGSWHQLKALELFESNLWIALGIGHPILVFVVREVGYDGPGTVLGVSGGPFVDWVAVERDYSVREVVAAETDPPTPATPLIPFPPTVAFPSPVSGMPNPKYKRFIVAHEICHALGLMGHSNSSGTDLMVPGEIKGDALSPFQVGIIRNSAHVTFL